MLAIPLLDEHVLEPLARALGTDRPVIVYDQLGSGRSDRITDTTLLRSVSSYGLVHSVNAAFMLVASVVLMGMIDPLLLAVTLAVLAINGLYQASRGS